MPNISNALHVTYRLHQLRLARPGDSDTARSLAATKDRVLRSPQSSFGALLRGKFDVCMAKSLALAIEENMHTFDFRGILQPVTNLGRGDILQNALMGSISSQQNEMTRTQGTLSMRSTTHSSP
jgi:hypothetical protein